MSESDSDQSSTDESDDENDDQCQVDESCDEKEADATVTESVNAGVDYESSSGDENDDHCPICLLRLKLQPIGRPEKCQHVYCLACITEWAKVTPSCPIDRLEFSNIFHRDHLAASESGHKPVAKKGPAAQPDDIIVIDEPETHCEVCRGGDREHLLLLCDGCDLGYHTTCLDPVLQEVPRGQWFCPTCTGLGVGVADSQAETRPFPAASVSRQAHVARSRTARSSSRRLRSGGNLITRTGQLERIRAAVNNARLELERRYGRNTGTTTVRRKRKVKRKPTKRKPSRKPTKKSTKTTPKKPRKVSRRKCSKRPNYHSRHGDSAILDNVRLALGLGEPGSHWSSERPGLAIFGSSNDLEPVGSEDEDISEVSLNPGGGVATRVMPRHLAVERINLARRRRQKLGVHIPEVRSEPVVDLLGGILNCQSSLLVKKPEVIPRDRKYLNNIKPSLNSKGVKVKTAPVNPSKGPAYGVSSTGNGGSTGAVSGVGYSTSPSHSYGPPVPEDNNDNSNGVTPGIGTSPPDDVDLYGNIEECDESTDPLNRSNESVSLPRLSAEGLRTLVQSSNSNMPYTPLAGLGPSQLPQLSASGLARLTESYKGESNDLYDPENPGDASDEEENLVIDDQKEDAENTPVPEDASTFSLSQEDPMKDTDAVSDTEIPQLDSGNEANPADNSDSANKIKIQIKTTSGTLGKPVSKTPEKASSSEGSPKKKSIIKDIFGSDEEPDIVPEGTPNPSVVIDAALISTIEENLAEEREKFEEEKKIALIEELRQEVEDYSDVSDREIEESREVRMKELSVSPINSDQSESFEKAATLEGLNPEAISPEEDFTSLSEEEEGEIKNYERRKKLKLKKRELQKKVRELERQVIEISPTRGALDLNGLALEEGEIHDEEKKKKKRLKDKSKGRKKIKKKIKTSSRDNTKEMPVDPVTENALTDNPKVEDNKENDENAENIGEAETTTNARNYRKKSLEKGEEKEEGKPEGKSSKREKRKRKEEKPKKPELQRYDVRRLLDAKKERKEKLKAVEPEAVPATEEVVDPTKDEFGRDLEKKEKIKKRKPSRSRSKSRGRKLAKKSRKRSSSMSSSSSSSSTSTSSSSSSRSRSRRRKLKTKKDTNKNKKIVLKKKLPVADKIRKKMRSRSRSRNKKRRKNSKSKSRSRSPSNRKKKIKPKEAKTTKSRERSKSRKRDRSRSGKRDELMSKNRKRSKSKNRERSKSPLQYRSRSKNRDRSRSRKSKSKHRSNSRSKKSSSYKKLFNESSSEKSVFASGDKIIVSVNFPQSGDSGNAKNRLDHEKSPPKSASKTAKSNQKPSVIIDILDEEAPYRVIETPKELVDISSDNEKENKILTQPVPKPSESLKTPQKVSPNPPLHTPSKGPMTPPEPDRYDPFDPTVSPDNEPESLPQDPQHTPPLQPSTPPPGPQTPPPASPSLPSSPPTSDNRPFLSSSPHHPHDSSPGVTLPNSPPPPKNNYKKRQPLYTTLPANVSAVLPIKLKPEVGSPMDMDLDSPFSPGSASDLSDLFEPPSSSPPPSSLPKISLPNLNSSRHHHKSLKKKPSDSKAWQNIIGEPGKPIQKLSTPRKLANTGPSSKLTVNMKVIDDKLKIIDDVPSSAVEMAVKEKVYRIFSFSIQTFISQFSFSS
eukprot:TRINITY_DN7890_c0_g1_i1.p1 TRINITY_DN7890_c0_g1~~TRINITY_DN7890_c0_g1_i1.p1  ORF type:complete len:1656 (-),score=536.89 TRINITY_DN7890_c0_g1_i1:497-5410(-)